MHDQAGMNQSLCLRLPCNLITSGIWPFDNLAGGIMGVAHIFIELYMLHIYVHIELKLRFSDDHIKQIFI